MRRILQHKDFAVLCLLFVLHFFVGSGATQQLDEVLNHGNAECSDRRIGTVNVDRIRCLQFEMVVSPLNCQ
jgi:hypothetical protein